MEEEQKTTVDPELNAWKENRHVLDVRWKLLFRFVFLICENKSQLNNEIGSCNQK